MASNTILKLFFVNSKTFVRNQDWNYFYLREDRIEGTMRFGIQIKKSISWLILCTGLIVSSVYINHQSNQLKHIIHADAAGYYSWLPAVFIYNDRNFEFCDTSYSKNPVYKKGYFNGILIASENGKIINKYPPGAAISSLPFFLLADAYGSIFNERLGIEKHYQISWLLSALFFLCIGIYYIHKIAELNATPAVVPFIVLCVVIFGTNLFQYATFDAGYSHAFTFGWVTLSLFYFNRFTIQKGKRDLIYFAIAAAMVVLVRPFNVLLLPVVLLVQDNVVKTIIGAIKQWKTLILSVFIFGLLISILFLSNYWQTYNAFIYPYGGEQFDFGNSHFIKFLFGYEIGAFLYSPLFLLLIATGLFFVARKNGILSSIVCGTYFFAIVWILSCWGTWTFGCTLGNRPLTDWYVIFAFPIIIGLNKIQYHLKTTVVFIFILLGIYYNQVLHYQYRNFIFNWCEMDRQKYWDIFMKTDLTYAYFTYDDWDFSSERNSRILAVYEIKNDVRSVPGFDNDFVLLKLDSVRTNDDKMYRMKVKMDVKFLSQIGDNKLAVKIENHGVYVDYLQKYLKKIVRRKGTWIPFEFEFIIKNSLEPLTVEVLLKDNKESPVVIRNMRSELISFEW